MRSLLLLFISLASLLSAVGQASIYSDPNAPIDARLDELGDLQALVERDGAVELMPRVVGLAIRAGCADLVAGIHGIDSESTPLRRIIAVHVSGLLAVGEGRRGEAVTLLTRAADEWLAFGNASEAAAARRDLLELAV